MKVGIPNFLADELSKAKNTVRGTYNIYAFLHFKSVCQTISRAGNFQVTGRPRILIDGGAWTHSNALGTFVCTRVLLSS